MLIPMKEMNQCNRIVEYFRETTSNFDDILILYSI